MNLEEIEAEVLRLSLSDRAHLAEKLLKSLDSLSEAEDARLWAEEAQRRHDELENATAIGRAGDDVFREARARLR